MRSIDSSFSRCVLVKKCVITESRWSWYCSFNFSVYLNFLFCIPTHKWDHMVFVFLCLTYLTWHSALKIYSCCHKWQDLTFYGWITFQCVCERERHFLYPFIHWWTLRLLPCLSVKFKVRWASMHFPLTSYIHLHRSMSRVGRMWDLTGVVL